MHLASVSASFRHGITIETSTAVGVVAVCSGARWASDIALETNDWRGGQLAGSCPPTPLSQAPLPNCEGDQRPDLKCNDPDGSPLERWYRPCGLFLLSRTCPSGPRPTLKALTPGRKTKN